MTRIERKQVWQEHITDCESSGLSARAYCKAHSLTYGRFIVWRKKLAGGQSTSDGVRPCGFARVAPVAEEQSSDGLTVLLPGGVSVTGLHGGNIALLGAILRQL